MPKPTLSNPTSHGVTGDSPEARDSATEADLPQDAEPLCNPSAGDIYRHHDCLLRWAGHDTFWQQQPYGNRFYFGDGALDYVPRDALRPLAADAMSAEHGRRLLHEQMQRSIEAMQICAALRAEIAGLKAIRSSLHTALTQAKAALQAMINMPVGYTAGREHSDENAPERAYTIAAEAIAAIDAAHQDASIDDCAAKKEVA